MQAHRMMFLKMADLGSRIADHFFEKWLSAFLQENQAKKGSFLTALATDSAALRPPLLQLRAYHFSALLDVFFSANVLKKVKIICVCFSRVVEPVISDDFSP